MKKISYCTNWMGPINTDWIAKHGEQWASGRIDVHGVDNPYGDEISLPPIHIEDWNLFSDWLEDFYTDTMWTLKQLVDEYEKTNPRILWLYGPPTDE
jgi:hypothetical protein